MTIATLDRLATPMIYAGVAVLAMPFVGPMIGAWGVALGWRVGRLRAAERARTGGDVPRWP